jgi:hypothetical protein
VFKIGANLQDCGETIRVVDKNMGICDAGLAIFPRARFHSLLCRLFSFFQPSWGESLSFGFNLG